MKAPIYTSNPDMPLVEPIGNITIELQPYVRPEDAFESAFRGYIVRMDITDSNNTKHVLTNNHPMLGHFKVESEGVSALLEYFSGVIESFKLPGDKE